MELEPSFGSHAWAKVNNDAIQAIRAMERLMTQDTGVVMVAKKMTTEEAVRVCIVGIQQCY